MGFTCVLMIKVTRGQLCDARGSRYRSGTVNSNTVNSKFHLIRSFCEIFARFMSFHV